MQRKIDWCKKKTKDEYREQYTKEILFMKKERRKYWRAFELEWTFGKAAMVHGLKYDPREYTFSVRLVYTVKSKGGNQNRGKKLLLLQKTGSRTLIVQKASSNMWYILETHMSLFLFLLVKASLSTLKRYTSWHTFTHTHNGYLILITRGWRTSMIHQVQEWSRYKPLGIGRSFLWETQPMRTDDKFVSQLRKDSWMRSNI